MESKREIAKTIRVSIQFNSVSVYNDYTIVGSHLQVVALLVQIALTLKDRQNWISNAYRSSELSFTTKPF